MLRGIYGSNQGIIGDRVVDFSAAILQIDPQGNAPFLAMSSGLPKESLTDHTFSWPEDVHQSMRTTITLNANDSIGTLELANASTYVVKQLLLIQETGEIVFVTAINGNQVTVTRGMGTAAFAATAGMSVQAIGSAHEEASEKPTAIAQQGNVRANVVQIFRNGWAVSGTAKVIKFRTGSKVARNKTQCAMFHAEDIERSAIWGSKFVGSFNNQPLRITDGLLSQIRQYGGNLRSANSAKPGAGAVAGQLSKLDFDDWLRQIFSKNVKGQPNERMAFCGDVALQAFNTMALLDGDYQISLNETSYGITIHTMVSVFGKLKMVTHPLMVENPIWQKELYVWHPGGVKKRVLRETFEENYDKDGLRANGKDADEGQITSELGFAVGAAQTMGIYSNIAVGVASK